MKGGDDAAGDANAFAELPAALEAAVPVTFFPEELVALLRSAPLSGASTALAREDLWAEAALLERLLYKSRSQHRSSRHYARLLEVRRGLRLLRSLALPARCAALRALLPAAPGGGHGAPPPRASLPCAAFAEHTARRLLAGSRLCASLRAPLARAAAECSALLAASYFMPLALAGLALCARVAALLRAQQAAAAAAYNALAPLMPALPPPHAARLTADPLPALLRCDWGEGDAPDVLAAVGTLAPRAAAVAQPVRAQPAARGDDVGTAVTRPDDEPLTSASLAAFVPFDDAAPPPKRARAQPPTSGPPAHEAAPALVFVDRGGGDPDAPIADEAAGGAAMLISAERPRYALLTQRTVDAAAAAAAEQAAKAAQAGGKRGRDGKDKRGGRGGGRGGGGDALSMLLGGTGMDQW